MKYLDLPALENINTHLSSVDVGDRVLNGRIEAYTSELNLSVDVLGRHGSAFSQSRQRGPARPQGP
jgi:hypothetical protein